MGNRESAQCDDQCARYSREPLPLTATSGINDLGLSWSVFPVQRLARFRGCFQLVKDDEVEKMLTVIAI